MPSRATRRASAQTYPALDSWGHAKVITVPLGDLVVDYEVPDLDAYIARGLIPNPLLPMARRVVVGIGPKDEQQMDDTDFRAYFDLRCRIIASHLRRPDLVAELGSEEAAIAWVAEQMPPGHRDILWRCSVHMFDAEQALRSLMDTLPFRDRKADGEPAADGGTVGQEAV